MAITPPAGATHWCCWRVISKNRAAGEGGRRERCTTDPGPEDEGRVRDAWPVSEWSTAKVLAQWGPGKYRVDWYDGKGDRMKEFGVLFDVAEPPARRGPRLRPTARAAAIEDDHPAPAVERVSQAVSGGGSIDLLTILSLLRQGEEAAEARAQRAADRQLEILVRMQEQTNTMLGRLTEGRNNAGDPDLLRRELSHTMREQIFALRQHLTAQQPNDDDDPDDIDPDAPPADMTEAGERIAMRFMREIEGMAPEALPKLIDFINRKIAGSPNGVPNGRANGS